jgi:hypothetical protein
MATPTIDKVLVSSLPERLTACGHHVRHSLTSSLYVCVMFSPNFLFVSLLFLCHLGPFSVILTAYPSLLLVITFSMATTNLRQFPFVSWNVRGLGDVKKYQLVKDILLTVCRRSSACRKQNSRRCLASSQSPSFPLVAAISSMSTLMAHAAAFSQRGMPLRSALKAITGAAIP